MVLVDGPFEQFSGCWTVEPLSADACKVSVALQIHFSSKVLAMAAKPLINPMADNLVDALVKRVHDVYQ